MRSLRKGKPLVSPTSEDGDRGRAPRVLAHWAPVVRGGLHGCRPQAGSDPEARRVRGDSRLGLLFMTPARCPQRPRGPSGATGLRQTSCLLPAGGGTAL